MATKSLHRPEIQGLRAVAVLAVIFGHTFTSYLPGGFIGVDIFFVISGFLITQQLLALAETERAIKAISIFYARRLKRILPSALLVIWVTIWLSFKYLGPVIGNDTLRDARWASLFFANQHFNSLKVDYFAQGIPASLLQHYWSLAVEEQFYLFWPILLILAVKFSKRYKSRALVALLSVAMFLSFSSIFITEEVLRYLSSFTRVWELACGALLAVIKVPKVSPIIGWVAIFTICSSFLFLDATSQIPGLAIVPTILSTCVLLTSVPKIVLAILASRIAHYLGDISFLLYLWHWPIIELHKQLAPVQLTSFELLRLILITLILAVITHHLFEKPIRFNSTLSQKVSLINLTGVIAIAISVIATFKLMRG